MSYLVLARKWRPQRFAEVVGQKHVTRTLSNAIEMDRVAHAFLFSGVRGVGKTSLARILARSLNCVEGPTLEPCGVCNSCTSIAAGTAVDVIEIDGASNNSVDDIRNLRETIPYRPAIGRFKIYVIDEVHMLSASAFNALLKTLEEPPPHVKFIFATTEAHKIPVTILSRCQRYDFRRIPNEAIIKRIREILESEEYRVDEGALNLIGREAEGSMRDALSILDQVLAAGAREITADFVAELLGVVERQVLYDVSRALLAGEASRVLEIVRQVDNQGYDIPVFAKELLSHFRNLVVAGICKNESGQALDLPADEVAELLEQATSVTTDTLHRLFKHFAEAFESISRSTHPRLLLETTLARIADLGELVPAAELIARLERLVKATAKGGSSNPGISRGSPPAPTAPSSSDSGSSIPERTSNSKSSAPVAENKSDIKTRFSEAEWHLALKRISNDRPSLASIMECAAPKMDGQRLTIAFGSEYASIATMAKQREREIQTILQENFGNHLEVDVVVDESAAVPELRRRQLENEEKTRKLTEEARQHPLVRQVETEFEARVSDIRVTDNPNR